MIENSKLNFEKDAQKKEALCACGCLDQVNESESEKSTVDKKIDRKNSCC